MSEFAIKQKRTTDLCLEELLQDKYSEPLTLLEVSSARINLVNFFETLVDIAKDNPEIIQGKIDLNNQRIEGKH
jgi:hypothetical protein